MQFLDILLGIITDEKSPAYQPTWEWFKQHFPSEYQGVAEEAVDKLRDLRLIVQEYRGRSSVDAGSDQT